MIMYDNVLYCAFIYLHISVSPSQTAQANFVFVEWPSWKSFWDWSGQMILEPLMVATYSPSLPCHRPARAKGFARAMAWHGQPTVQHGRKVVL